VINFKSAGTVVPLIQKEFRPNQKNCTTSNDLRNPTNFVYIYRSLEVMHRFMMDVVGNLILPYSLLGAQIVLFCNVSILRDTKVDAILVIISTFTLIILFVGLEFCGRFYKNSQMTIKSWQNFNCSKSGKQIINKFRKGCVPLKFETRGYFVIRRSTALVFLKGIIRGTFRVLLTLKDA